MKQSCRVIKILNASEETKKKLIEEYKAVKGDFVKFIENKRYEVRVTRLFKYYTQ